MFSTTSFSCLLLTTFIHTTYGFIQGPQKLTITRRFMGDHSSATLFKVGDTVTVIDDVMKAGRNLRGLTGVVTETWEKCDVDPTCCCAEWVDEGLSVHVKFNVPTQSGEVNDDSLLVNDIFVHYFAESELEKYGEPKDFSAPTSNDAESPFDGLSCKAFKLDKLKMGEQAQRIASFEASRGI